MSAPFKSKGRRETRGILYSTEILNPTLYILNTEYPVKLIPNDLIVQMFKIF